ncbi:hypothetical protein HPP92_014484 [Vanilla planifolia]|uniref:Uncharacterized protein n=1 Tax=Vanilla planifolia TaxID=51239 RepID=A0A835USS2_VANPL|nr:hypothetical protein HPP92_014484 [Vanilla planifolia]
MAQLRTEDVVSSGRKNGKEAEDVGVCKSGVNAPLVRFQAGLGFTRQKMWILSNDVKGYRNKGDYMCEK